MNKFLCVILMISLCSCKNLKDETPSINDLTTVPQKSDNLIEMQALQKPYNPNEDAKAQIDKLIEQAKLEDKNILIQAGGNWCIWCLRFDKFKKETLEIKRIIEENFLYYHLNFSKENENKEIFERYGNPGNLGYPVFIVLDKNGKLIHTQESGSLEDGAKGYNVEKVKAFLNFWKP